jgi:hypothetical protein
MNDTEAVPITGFPEAALELANEALRAERRHIFQHPQRDVRGTLREGGSLDVMNDRSRDCGPARSAGRRVPVSFGSH